LKDYEMLNGKFSVSQTSISADETIWQKFICL